MLDSYKNYNSSSSHYFTLAQQFYPNHYRTSASISAKAPSYLGVNRQQNFTFKKDFYPSPYLSSAYRQKQNHNKYRSASLPSQCLVTNLNPHHFSYYDQLRKRDYIVPKNYRSFSQLKKDYDLLKLKSYQNLHQPNSDYRSQKGNLYNNPSSSSIHSADLNRFYKYAPHKKLSKGNFINKTPIISTNVKVYSKPDHNDRVTQIYSNFSPHSNHYQASGPSNHQDQRNSRHAEIPIVDCSIQVKSDDDGRYYSTVSSQYPTLINHHNSFYDPNQNIFTTQALLVKECPNSFENIENHKPDIDSKRFQNKINPKNVDKDCQTGSKNKTKQYDTYILRRKTSPLKSQQKYLQNASEPNHYLESMENRKHVQVSKEQIPEAKSPIKRKIIIEYQIDSTKKIKSPRKINRQKSKTKINTQNAGLKYYYSKYYLAQLQKNKQNRSKSSSIRKSQKSQRKQKTKKSTSKYETQHKNTKKLVVAHSPKTKDKFSRPCHANYASTHLLTVKK